MYSWSQIKQCVKDVYNVDANRDTWNVPVIYEEAMLLSLQKRLRRIKQFIK